MIKRVSCAIYRGDIAKKRSSKEKRRLNAALRMLLSCLLLTGALFAPVGCGGAEELPKSGSDVSTDPYTRVNGGWPDYAQLADLVDKPDAFIQAINIEELTAAYKDAKDTGTLFENTMSAEINIDDSDIPSDAESSFDVFFNDEGEILNFCVRIRRATGELTSMGDDIGNLIVYEMGLANGIAPPDYEERAVRIIEEAANRYTPTPLFTVFFSSPVIRVCNKAGISTSETEINESKGFASWAAGCLAGCKSFAAHIKEGDFSPNPVRSGRVYDAYGKMPNSSLGYYVLEIASMDTFEPENPSRIDSMAFWSAEELVLMWARESFSITAEQRVKPQLNTYENAIWTFEEGNFL